MKKKRKRIKFSRAHDVYQIRGRRRRLLSREFMLELKVQLEFVFTREMTNMTDVVRAASGTGGFMTALKTTCQKFNLMKAIYEFVDRQEWYIYDVYCDDILEMFAVYGIIPEGELDDDVPLEYMISDGYLVKRTVTKYRGGYSVVRTELTDDYGELEEPDPPNTTITFEFPSSETRPFPSKF